MYWYKLLQLEKIPFRLLQTLGRSGHRPGATSVIHFVPTHSLELLECAALRKAIDQYTNEDRIPYLRSLDVLIQYMVTLAVSDGFESEALLSEVRSTTSYFSISDEEWHWCLDFIVRGGQSLTAYDDYHKVVKEDGVYKVVSRKVAMRHKFNIGTIVSSMMVKVKLQKGSFLGHVEEYFISKLMPGDSFWFAGRCLELVRFRGVEATVRLSKATTGAVPSYMVDSPSNALQTHEVSGQNSPGGRAGGQKTCLIRTDTTLDLS